METSLKAPQFPVEGLVSQSFYIDMMPSIKGEHEEMLFVESMLTALVDSFGDAFTARITSGYRKDNMKVDTVLFITFPEYKWLWDVVKMTASFGEEMVELLEIKRVYIPVDVCIRNGNWGGSETARIYELSVKEGIYEVKKTYKLEFVVKTINGITYPSYSKDEVDF